MNKQLLLLLILLRLNAGAQLINSLSVNRLNQAGFTPKDTIISKNPDDTLAAYVIIKNPNEVIIARGKEYNGKRDGTWREYNNAGILTKLEEYKYGLKNGASLTFSFIGQVQSDSNFENDTLNGIKFTFMNNGRIKTMENYLKGNLHGHYKSYYDDLKLQEESNYKYGQRDSLCKWYFQNGKPSVEYYYLNGKLEGPSVEYNEDGTKKQEGNYKDNNEDGEWKIYEQGKPARKIYYSKGKLIKIIAIK